MSATITKEMRQEWGRRGGKATVANHGKGYMASIGATGYQVTVERHFKGDGIKCQLWLNKKAGMPRLAKNHSCDYTTIPSREIG